LSVLNSDDEQTKVQARNSFDLHMSKRKIKVAPPNSSNSFGGYETTDTGLLKRGTKVNWPRSVWVELNELCVREDIQLCKDTNNDFVIKCKAEEDVLFLFRQGKPAYQFIVNKHKWSRKNRFNSLKSQGRVLNSQEIDHQVSHAFMRNFNISDKISQFVVKGRLQLLECNSLLHKYYPNTYAKKCKLCHNPFDTVSHILNGCMEFRNNYTARHNRVVAHIESEFVKNHPHFQVFREKIPTQMLGIDAEQFQELTHTKPDLFLVNQE